MKYLKLFEEFIREPESKSLEKAGIIKKQKKDSDETEDLQETEDQEDVDDSESES